MQECSWGAWAVEGDAESQVVKRQKQFVDELVRQRSSAHTAHTRTKKSRDILQREALHSRRQLERVLEGADDDCAQALREVACIYAPFPLQVLAFRAVDLLRQFGGHDDHQYLALCLQDANTGTELM